MFPLLGFRRKGLAKSFAEHCFMIPDLSLPQAVKSAAAISESMSVTLHGAAGATVAICIRDVASAMSARAATLAGQHA